MKFILWLFLHQTFSLEHRFKAPTLFMNTQEKFCKDCRFFKKEFFTETKYGHCSKFPNQPTDSYLVDGIKDLAPMAYYYCTTARSYDQMCGREGKYFESKNG